MAQALSIQRQRYAAAFQFLDAQLPQVSAAQPAVWAAFRMNSHLDEDEARAAVALAGTPPLIFGSTLGASVWGQFDPEVPGRVEVSADVLQRFAADAGDPAAQQFLVAKVLHELCHWGCFRKQVPDNDNSGEDFEQAAFGRELGAWWLQAPAAVAAAAAAAIAPDMFTDPAVRAGECSRLLVTRGHVPGRLAEPNHSVFGGEDVAEPLPRGFRNNNPGNIRATGTAWKGLADPTEMEDFQARETSFCVFKEPEWGLRAMAVILRGYKHKHGLVTPRAIIGRWAPASDHNDVASYSAALAAALGVGPDDLVDADDDPTLVAMLRAITRHENGIKPPYAEVQYQAALLLI